MQEARSYLDANPTMAKIKKSQETIGTSWCPLRALKTVTQRLTHWNRCLSAVLGTATVSPHPPLTSSGSIEQFGRCIYEVSLKKPKTYGHASTLHIFVEPADKESDPDLFVSNLCHQPTAADSEWTSQGGGSDHIIIPPSDPFFSYGRYWFSVVAPSGPASYNVKIWAVESKFESLELLSSRRTDESIFAAIQGLNKRQKGNMVQAAASVRAAAAQVRARC
jgi:hypothetical protein